MSHDITGFTYRGLSPHKFTPMPGVHIFLHLTGVPLRSTPAGEKCVSSFDISRVVTSWLKLGILNLTPRNFSRELILIALSNITRRITKAAWTGLEDHAFFAMVHKALDCYSMINLIYVNRVLRTSLLLNIQKNTKNYGESISQIERQEVKPEKLLFKIVYIEKFPVY